VLHGKRLDFHGLQPRRASMKSRYRQRAGRHSVYLCLRRDILHLCL
jgi:hypothetical protein